ncbi:MAG: 30S ribosomal protein S12 methylthiotransferase RimO [Saprospiraceae bacterium]|nr:30S ribosomal protein S12 methylthiotransferase RimO [Saprospiraceae bacterium]
MKTKKEKVTLINMGCSKNLIDSENIITHLNYNGFEASFQKGNKSTQTVVINTCGFIHDAKTESIDAILQFADLKTKGKIKKLYVTGCLSQRYKDDLIQEIPEVDGFFGTDISEILKEFNVQYREELLGERTPTTAGHYAYLKIAEGCSRACAFCAIPGFRGKHISRTIDDIICEAENLAAKGIKELILISQELTYYGLDLYNKRNLAELLNELVKIEGIEWIRLHYLYPGSFPQEVLETMAKHDKICNYLDMPLQHINDDILKRMKRFSTKSDALNIISQARELIPDIALRTTFIVGFPGETDEQFQELLDFLEEMKFDRVGVFEYSHEEGTSAFSYVDDVPAKVKKHRAQLLMELQREISLEKNQDKVGKEFEVIIDSADEDYYYGRTQYDSPEVDNEVLIEKATHLEIGSIVRCKITEAQDYDLFGAVFE